MWLKIYCATQFWQLRPQPVGCVMCSVSSAVSGETLAVLDLDEGKTGKEIKQSLAAQIGVTRFRQRILEDSSREVEDDEVVTSEKLRLVVLEFWPPDFEEDKKMIEAARNNEVGTLENLLKCPRNPNTDAWLCFKMEISNKYQIFHFPTLEIHRGIPTLEIHDFSHGAAGTRRRNSPALRGRPRTDGLSSAAAGSPRGQECQGLRTAGLDPFAVGSPKWPGRCKKKQAWEWVDSPNLKGNCSEIICKMLNFHDFFCCQDR